MSEQTPHDDAAGSPGAAEAPPETTAEAPPETTAGAPHETPAEAPPEADTPAATPAATPTPSPAPRPKPRPAPRHRPGGRRQRSATAAAVAEPPVPVRPPSAPAPWGRVADDGTVYVTTAEGERPVGSYPDAAPEEALAYFGRKYDDLVAQVDLAEQRLDVPGAPLKDVVKGLEAVKTQLPEAAVVGDLVALAARVAALDAVVAERRKVAERARADAKQEARVARAALVEEAEAIAATEPARIQWKASGERMQELFEAWKTAQRSGARLDKPVEEELWRRFSHSRTAFDRARKHHFAQLNVEHGAARAAKEKLVTEAEALSGSRDWASTVTAYRALMDRWRAAGRAGRKEDDALWARFRAAQDTFFEARNADQAVADAEFVANLQVKEALLVEAEALVPVQDLDTAKTALRGIQDRWDAAGKVPRADLARVEKRMRAVEQAVRDVEDGHWKSSNPEGKARADSALGQLEESIAGLEQDLEMARSAGNARKVIDAEQALSARRAWLDQVRRAADDFS